MKAYHAQLETESPWNRLVPPPFLTSRHSYKSYANIDSIAI